MVVPFAMRTFSRAKNGTDVYAKIDARTIKGKGCWRWNGTAGGVGYPQISLPNKGKIALVSRLVLSRKLGRTLESTECACHSCDNGWCVNPDHLFVGTKADNSQDMVNKGRSTRGSKNPQAKLTESQVLEIRAATGLHRVIGRRFGVTRQTVDSIKLRKVWGYL